MPKAKSKSTHTKTQATKVSDESAPKPHGTKRKTIADAATIETEDLASSVENNAIVKEKRRKTGKKLYFQPPSKDVSPPKKLTKKHWRDLQQKDYIPTDPADIVLSCGQGDMGQLGHGPDRIESTKPRRIDGWPEGTKFLQIAAGGMHTALLTTKNEVLTFGMNDDGALGRPCEDPDSGVSFEGKPVKFPLNVGKIVMISAGDSHTAALTETGAVVSWGTFRNKEKPMGLTAAAVDEPKLTEPVVIYQPELIKRRYPIVKISSGCHHLLLLNSEGQILTTGAGDSGQLGRVPARENLRYSGNESRLQPQVLVIPDVRFSDVWATAYGSVGKAFPKGELHVWGQNNYLQLGIKTKEVDIFRPKVSKTFPSKEKSWKKLIGEHHVLALDESGNVWGIGRGDDHKLGQGDDVTNKDSLVKIEIPNGGKVIDIAASQATSVVATEAGVFAWGFNTNKELGLGPDVDEVKIPTKVESKHLDGHLVTNVSLGGQHLVLMAKKLDESESDAD